MGRTLLGHRLQRWHHTNHMNLLKAWRDIVSVSVGTPISEKDELGHEVPKSASSPSALSTDHLSPSQRGDVEALQQYLGVVDLL